MTQTDTSKTVPPSPVWRGFRILLKALSASDSGATALGYALALAASVMFAGGVIGQAGAERPGAVMPGDMDGPPSE